MSAPRENRTLVTGTVETVEEAGGGAALRLRVERAEAVPGFPSLLPAAEGSGIRVTLAPGQPAPRVGDTWQHLVKLAGPGLYAAVPA